jgi:hypothetical protein
VANQEGIWNAGSGVDLQFRALFERPESWAKLP